MSPGHTSNMKDQNKFSFFFSELEKHALPGYEAHVELTPYRKHVQPPETSAAHVKQGAVAVIVHRLKENGFILLTRRASYQGVHGGQISFPGGKKDEKDENMLEAAKRETMEEMGISLMQLNPVKELSSIYIPPSNFMVYPFLFITEEKLIPQLNHEVEYVLELPVSELERKDIMVQRDIKLHNGTILKNIPCFLYKEEIIWGATAAILNELAWMLRNFSQK